METIRQNRAEQLSQELMQNRAERKAEVEAMFQRLGVFRVELKRFYANLQAEVWGSGAPASGGFKAQKPFSSQAVAAPAAKVNVPVAVPVPPTTVGAFSHGDSIAVAPAKSAKPAIKSGSAVAEDVYTFIRNANGARLTQIESSLSINRFQAVDALRSLIKDSRITQRDRIYLAVVKDLAHT
jgi:hypothetical protein